MICCFRDIKQAFKASAKNRSFNLELVPAARPYFDIFILYYVNFLQYSSTSF
jgi:hypothetical protein